MFADVKTDASYALVHWYGAYTTNLSLNVLMNEQAWIVFRLDGQDLAPEQGGPARLLVPHLYFWKSAKWVPVSPCCPTLNLAFGRALGYHNHGDPWREKRYWGD